MAEHLLGKITLAKDYNPTSTVDDAVVSDLQNASVFGAATNILLSNQLNITADFPAVGPFGADLPMGVTIGFSYGTQFNVSLDVDVTTAGETTRNIQIQLLNSSNVVIAEGALTSLASGANPVSSDIVTDGSDWTKVRLKCKFKGGTGPTYEYSNLTVTNSAASVFNTGDNIIVYWDDSAEDFIVQRQDNPTGTITTISAGPNLGPLETEQFFDGGFYKYCDGTTLVMFTFTFDSPEFPYFGKELWYGNNLCLAGNIACDVRFVTADISGATNAYSSDGQVQLTAYFTGYPDSLNAIKYTEFNPGTDIRGQYANAKNTSGLFSSLKSGTYTFYAVDTYGCYNSIQVVIPSVSNSSYNPKYRVRYYDVHTEVQSTIDIQERGYGGDVVYVDGGDSSPFKLSKESGELNNKLEVIRKTFGELTLNSGEHFQFISLYSQDEKKFKLSFTHGSTTWIGYLVSSAYQESYSPSRNYPVTVTATDGLASLGDYDFVDQSGNLFSGLLSVRGIILECLNKIGLRLNLVIGVNKYAADMDSDTDDDPLGQTYIDAETFSGKKCDEVLEMVLKPLAAFVQQVDSKWFIIEFESQTEPYYYREYDYLGAFVTSGQISPVINIDRPYVNLENVLFSGQHNLEIVPAYGRMSVNSSLEGRESIFPLSLDRWSPNIVNGGGSLVGDDTESDNKLLTIYGGTTGYFRLLSPEFDVKTIADSLDISWKVKADYSLPGSIDVNGLFVGFNPTNYPPAKFLPMAWTLRCTVNDVDFYFNKSIGWSRESAWGTSTTSISIPTTHPSTRTITTQTGLSISAGGVVKIQNSSSNYFRAVITSYNHTTGALECESFCEIGSGTFASWTIYNAGSEYNLNRVYVDKYREFIEFSESVDLPIQSPSATPTSTVQFILLFYGDQHGDYVDGFLDLLPSATLPAGYKARSTTGGFYELRQGTQAESLPTYVRPDDYDGTTNAVYWELQTGSAQPSILSPVLYTLKDIRVKFLPGKQNLLENHIVSFINDQNFREVLEYELEVCDIPTELQAGHEAYKNIFRYSDGSPTSGWARRGINESHLLQELVLKTLGNQYSTPSWRLSGDWLGPDIKFNSIIRHTVKQITYSSTNADLPGGSGWEQVGVGTAWTNGVTYYQAAFTGAGDSLIIRQAANLVAGARIKVDFNLIRLSSDGTRVDRLVLVLYNGATIIQTETILDKIETDTDSTWSATIFVENVSDKIGFYIDNMTGSGAATYRINYFSATGIPSVRYYYPSRIDRQDKMNLYRAELTQIVPVSRDNDVDDVNGSGGFAGDSWSSGFSTGFGAGFNSGGYWG